MFVSRAPSTVEDRQGPGGDRPARSGDGMWPLVNRADHAPKSMVHDSSCRVELRALCDMPKLS